MASIASGPPDSNSTKPKPLDLLESLSVITFADMTLPNSENNSSN